jgi:hypothetical protein
LKLLLFEADAMAVEEPPAVARCSERQGLERQGKKECRSMHVHMDRKWLEWLDGNGNAIAFFLISLLIVIAFAY